MVQIKAYEDDMNIQESHNLGKTLQEFDNTA